MVLRTSSALTVSVLVSLLPLAAHDMWIEPTSFLPETGEIVAVKLRVGQDLLGDPLPRDPSLINEFIVVDSEGRKPVVGRDGRDPAGFVRVPGPGLLVVGYHSNPSRVEIKPEIFNQYLKDEGLDAVAAVRSQRNQVNATAHEQFSRCAKSLVLSGVPLKGQGDRVLGFPLELVAERDPYTVRPSENLRVRLLYEHRPLAGALVTAMNRLNPIEKIRTRTDAQGRVNFRLHPGGMWLIKAVHMIAAPTGSGAEWQSYWASLTFGLPAQQAQRN